MAIFRFRRKKPSRKRAAAQLLPEPMGLSGPARRVNRFVAVVTLFGALGSVALAVALTPGAQTSPSRADASQTALAISEIKGPAPAIVEATLATPAVAALPQRAAKSDRLSPVSWSPRPVALDRSPDPEPLRGSLGNDVATERAMAVSSETLETAPQPTASLELEVEANYGFAPPPARAPEVVASAEAGTEPSVDYSIGTSSIEPDAEATIEPTAEAVDEALTESSDEAVEEAVGEAVEEPVALASTAAATETGTEPAVEPAPEAVTPTRTAAVRTDVNLRSKPANGSKSILVVPGGKEVEVIGCDFWCEVIYAGKRGFIYKGFFPGGKKASVPSKKKASVVATEEASPPAAKVASSAPSPDNVRRNRPQDR